MFTHDFTGSRSVKRRSIREYLLTDETKNFSEKRSFSFRKKRKVFFALPDQSNAMKCYHAFSLPILNSGEKTLKTICKLTIVVLHVSDFHFQVSEVEML